MAAQVHCRGNAAGPDGASQASSLRPCCPQRPPGHPLLLLLSLSSNAHGENRRQRLPLLGASFDLPSPTHQVLDPLHGTFPQLPVPVATSLTHSSVLILILSVPELFSQCLFPQLASPMLPSP